MRKDRRFIVKLIIVLSVIIMIVVLLGSGYTWWNHAPPEKTCASCHEISSSVHSLSASSHRDLKCMECHGTALNNGFHSIKEKSRMVVNHYKKSLIEEIRLNEKQLIEVMDNCRNCHASEYAGWRSGGHSMNYQHVFMNEKQNLAEQINSDCLRCHGMFFEGTVYDVVRPVNTTGPWKINNINVATRSAIPCMACHQIHQPGVPAVSPDYSDPKAVFYEHVRTTASVSFYDRNEKAYFKVEELPELKLWHQGKPVTVSADVRMRNCGQCHAPNVFHISGTSDDRTPRGVHEGLSCMACHEPHSNNARNSCATCHPAISNCGLDVTTMNTTFADISSQLNIHFVSCADCHQNGI